ncbi:MAG TPA: DUF4159 domain-containing protein [Thermoanaerobaculia bacterium]|nr:DUF4159 domain-containing protein [Thermoanaerobaculia bacterium]
MLARGSAALLLATVALGSGVALSMSADRPVHRSPDDEGERSAFSFVRVRYDSSGGYNEAFYDYDGRRWERWETDHPQADENFLFRLAEITAIRTNPRSVVRRLTDEDLFSFPLLYLSDVGWMVLSPAEVAALREYLLRGGFLWADDFWGLGEWQNFERAMRQVLPEVEWREIPPGHAILRLLFPLAAPPQIPARDFAEMGMTHDPPGYHRYPASGIEQVAFRGWFAADGRLLALATFNTDIGDGWEREAYGQWFFERYSTLAYAAGANIVLYAMTQ